MRTAAVLVRLHAFSPFSFRASAELELSELENTNLQSWS